MGKTFEATSAEVNAMVLRVMNKHHRSTLAEYDVTIGAIMATAYNKNGEEVTALITRGQAVAAKIKVTSLDDRALGVADAKLTINHFVWERLPEASREALIDHELTHLQLNPDAEDNYFDDLKRPRLATRHHDWELTGFAEVATRHGEASIEAHQVNAFRAGFGEQLGLWQTAHTT